MVRIPPVAGRRFDLARPNPLRAGITDHLIDASAGLTARDRDYLLGRGVGIITSLVARATAGAEELGPAELAEGARALAGTVRRFRPRVVAILGVTAYRTAFGYPRAVPGRQPEDLDGAQLWVVPNPSGRNAHAPLDTLAAAYREVALAAAIELSVPLPHAGPACGRRHGRHRRCRDRVRVVTEAARSPSVSGSADRAIGGRVGGRGRLGSRTSASPGPPRRRTNGTCSQTQVSHRLGPGQRRCSATPSGCAARQEAARAVRSVRTVEPDRPGQFRILGPNPEGTRMTSTQHVRVEGTSYQRGLQYGRQAATRVRLSVQAYQQAFAHFAGWDWATVRREAVRFEAPIGAFRPAYLEEMRGIADGAGLDPTDVLAINVRTEVMYSAKARQAPRAEAPPARRVPAECSAFAHVPGPGQPGPAILGQNWDWLLHAAQTLVMLEARPDDGPDFVTVVEAGLLAKAGMNAAGLGLVTNALVTDADVGEPGLPYHVLLRAVLDCATVTEAVKVLQAGPRSSSANYLIAHASGAALDIEAAPGDFTRLYPLFPEDGVLLHTNHFLAPRIDPVDLALWAMPSTAVRLQRLRAATAAQVTTAQVTTAQVTTAWALDDLRALLADHADYPHSICAPIRPITRASRALPSPPC